MTMDRVPKVSKNEGLKSVILYVFLSLLFYRGIPKLSITSCMEVSKVVHKMLNVSKLVLGCVHMGMH